MSLAFPRGPFVGVLKLQFPHNCVHLRHNGCHSTFQLNNLSDQPGIKETFSDILDAVLNIL